MFKRLVEWIDNHLWSLPFLLFVAAETTLVILDTLSGPFLLAEMKEQGRKDIYSSLTGSSSGLLGFTLAAVAIITAFGPKPAYDEVAQDQEDRLAQARVGVSKVLLATSVFLLITLVAATLGVGVKSGPVGVFVLASLVTSASFASLVGLLVSGLGLFVALVDRGNPG